MRLPPPEFVLYVLGAFLVGYGLWLSVRALRARRWREPLEACPECAKAWEDKAAAKCARCGARRPVASAIRAARFWVVLGLVVSLGGLGTFVGGALVADAMRSEREFGYGWGDSGFKFGPYLGGGMGLSLFGLFLAILAWRGDRPRGRRRCPKCWYLVDPAVGLRCSECGHEAKGERALFRPRRRWRLAVLGLLVLGAGQLGWYESRVRNHGWLSVVPTEVMILGLPWLPDEWVGGTSWVEWSLIERYSEGRMWDWQEAWFRDRSHGWLLAARSPSEMADRAAVLSGPHGWLAGAHDGSPASIRRLGEQLLDMATQALEAGDPLSAHQLLRPMADLADVLIAEPAEEARAFSTKVDGATPTLLRHISDAPFEIGVLLASGSGTPEVVEALAIRADPRDSGETLSSLDIYQANYALARLIRRGNQLATTRVAAMIADEANPLRIHTAAYVAWANREAANPELDAALLSLLESTDADDLIRSINAVEARGGPLLEPAIRRAIDLARKRPDLAPRIEDALTTRDYVMVLHRHIPELIELAQQPQLRNVGCSLLLVACINAPLLDVGLLDRFEALLDDPAIAHRAPSIREQIGHIRARIEHQQAMEAHRNSIDLGGG